MDKDMKCCWNCQLRTDDKCQLLCGKKEKSILEDAKPCGSWAKRIWGEETTSGNIGPFGDQNEYVDLKAKHPNSIFCFMQSYFNQGKSYNNLLHDYKELEKIELRNEEFLNFVKTEIPDVYKKLKSEYKKQIKMKGNKK